MNEVEITPENGISEAEVNEAITYLLAKKAKQASDSAMADAVFVAEKYKVSIGGGGGMAVEIENPEFDSNGAKVDYKKALDQAMNDKYKTAAKPDPYKKPSQVKQEKIEADLADWLKSHSEVGPFHHEPTDKAYWLVRLRHVSGDHLRIQVMQEGLGLYGDHHENNLSAETQVAKWLEKNEDHPKYGKFRSLYSGSKAFYMPALLVINGNGNWVIRVVGSSDDGNREYGMSFSVDEATVSWLKKATKIGKGK